MKNYLTMHCTVFYVVGEVVEDSTVPFYIL